MMGVGGCADHEANKADGYCDLIMVLSFQCMSDSRPKVTAFEWIMSSDVERRCSAQTARADENEHTFAQIRKVPNAPR